MKINNPQLAFAAIAASVRKLHKKEIKHAKQSMLGNMPSDKNFGVSRENLEAMIEEAYVNGVMNERRKPHAAQNN